MGADMSSMGGSGAMLVGVFYKGTRFPQIKSYTPEGWESVKHDLREAISKGVERQGKHEMIRFSADQLDAMETAMNEITARQNGSSVFLSEESTTQVVSEFCAWLRENMKMTGTDEEVMSQAWVCWTMDVICLLDFGVIQDDELYGFQISSTLPGGPADADQGIRAVEQYMRSHGAVFPTGNANIMMSNGDPEFAPEGSEIKAETMVGTKKTGEKKYKKRKNKKQQRSAMRRHKK